MPNLESLQAEIMTILGLTSEQVNFSYKEIDGIVHLDLMTINPRHQQAFLFHSVKAIDKSEAMQKMLDYVKINFKKEDSYTLQWSKVGDQSLHTSYFRAKNIYEILDKFYFERDLNSYRIYSISLNPIS
jgi:hypothetical protein